jgi:hypothetical protein
MTVGGAVITQAGVHPAVEQLVYIAASRKGTTSHACMLPRPRRSTWITGDVPT